MRFFSKVIFLALLSVGVLFTTTASAQKFEILYSPDKYSRPTGNEDYSDSGGRGGSVWIVFSDRSDNPTYSSAGGGSTFQKMNYLEPYYVIGEEGDYVRLGKGSGDLLEDMDDDGYLVGGSDYGWVHKKDILLWRHCLITENKIDKKAMLLNTVKGLDPNNIKMSDLKKVTFYENPGLTKDSGKSASLFDFFYIYKYANGAVLLGKDASVPEPDRIKTNLMGWVPERKIVLWDHRVVAEKNWEPPAVKERLANNTKARVFYKENDAKLYKTNRSVSDQHAIWFESQVTSERDPGKRKRFPILEKDKELGIMKLGAMGQVYNREGVVDKEVIEDLQDQWTKDKMRKRNVNIIFVVDGTKGMKPYYSAITNAINSAKNKLSKKSKNTVKFGAVVYRDAAAGKQIVEFKTAKTNPKALINFLSSEVNTNYEDKDIPEAVNYGIATAIRNAGVNENETNIILVVAGSANHYRKDAQYKSEDLIKILHAYNCHLFGFLVNNETEDHNDFIFQMQEIMMGIAEKNYNSVAGDPKMKDQLKQFPQFLQKPEFIDLEDKYELQRTATMGSIHFAEFGEEMEPSHLQKELGQIIVGIDGKVDEHLAQTDFIIMGYGKEFREGGAEAANLGLAFFNYLRRSEFTEGQIANFKKDNIQLYQPGFSPVMIEGHKFPLFKSSLFMNQLELSDLVQTFKRFDAAAGEQNMQKRREEMKEVWIAILQEYVGGDREDFEGLDMYDINEQVFGLPGSTEFLQGIKLRDITDVSRFTEVSFAKYTARIRKKYNEILRIYTQDEYEYSFRSNDLKYYWISEDLLP